MSYYEDEPRSHFGLYVALGVITFCLLGYFGLSSLLDSSSKQSAQPERSNQTPPKNEAPPETLTLPVDDLPEPTEEETLIDTGLQIDALKPETLLKQIGDSLKHGDFEAALTLIGEDNIAPEHHQRLKKLHSENRLQLDSESPVIEIGELDRNRRTRFALNLGNDQPPIYLDLARDPSNGKWSVEKAKLPPEQTITPTPSILTDSLGIGHAFLKASLAQQFDLAKSYVDSSQVSDAKIAGLCIIFEEANYHLRPKKPLRAMFNRETVAAFKAHVQAADGQSAAEFGPMPRLPGSSPRSTSIHSSPTTPNASPEVTSTSPPSQKIPLEATLSSSTSASMKTTSPRAPLANSTSSLPSSALTLTKSSPSPVTPMLSEAMTTTPNSPAVAQQP